MKNIFLVALMLIGLYSYGQTDFQIEAKPPNNICVGETVKLEIKPAPNLAEYTILWEPSGETKSNIEVKPNENTNYKAIITKDSDASIIELNYEVILKKPANALLESSGKTCFYNNPFEESLIEKSDSQYHNAALSINNEDGQAYSYDWQFKADDKYKDITEYDDGRIHLDGPNNSPIVTRVFALPAKFDIAVRVSFGDEYCSFIEKQTEVQKVADITIMAEPEKEVYLQNPIGEFSFEDNDSDNPTSAWIWKFTDPKDKSDTTTRRAPAHTFLIEGEHLVELLVINQNRCDTIYEYPYDVKPVKLMVPNYLIQGTKWEIAIDNSTPDTPVDPSGTGKYFKIGEDQEVLPLNSYYQSCDLLVFDRWGKKIYQTDDYQNDWTADNIKSGVYYYTLKCKGFTRNDTYTGSVTIFVR